jgi:VIT1/CCC1 family predicted Fe2+/Mn2+ transporter
MPDDSTKSRKRLLDPMERTSEILFGLIMVLTFTCSFSVANAGRSEVREMLITALGCNLAWGIIDAIFYLMGCLGDQGHNILALRALRKTADRAEAHRMIADAMPPALASVLLEVEFEAMREKLNRLPEPPAHPRLAKHDWLAAFGVFLLVFLSTFPVVIPFLFIHEARLALRVSNAVAIAMLFMAGYAFGRYSGFRPGRVALAMVVLGMAMVGITIVFGG